MCISKKITQGHNYSHNWPTRGGKIGPLDSTRAVVLKIDEFFGEMNHDDCSFFCKYGVQSLGLMNEISGNLEDLCLKMEFKREWCVHACVRWKLRGVEVQCCCFLGTWFNLPLQSLPIEHIREHCSSFHRPESNFAFSIDVCLSNLGFAELPF